MSDDFSHKSVGQVASIIAGVVLVIGCFGLYFNIFIQ